MFEVRCYFFSLDNTDEFTDYYNILSKYKESVANSLLTCKLTPYIIYDTSFITYAIVYGLYIVYSLKPIYILIYSLKSIACFYIHAIF